MNSNSSVASRLQPLQRQEIAVKVLAKQEPITEIAKEKQVSRKGSDAKKWHQPNPVEKRNGGAMALARPDLSPRERDLGRGNLVRG